MSIDPDTGEVLWPSVDLRFGEYFRETVVLEVTDEAGLTASVPLVLESRVTGAITVFNLLGQKPGLEPVDLQLFDLLASHAATALHCTRMPDEPSKDSSARG